MIISLTLIAALTVIPVAQATQTPTTHEYRIAHSTDAKDWMGYEPSLYTGKWYSPKHETIRKCVMYRESRFNYRGANKTSSARGAYQFLDSQWRDGLVWMMLDESKKTKDGLTPAIKKLRNKPIHEWNRYYQDRAFWTAWRFGDGKKHWSLQADRCY